MSLVHEVKHELAEALRGAEGERPQLKKVDDGVYESTYRGVHFKLLAVDRHNRKKDGVEPQHKAKLWGFQIPQRPGNHKPDYSYTAKRDALGAAMRSIDSLVGKGILNPS